MIGDRIKQARIAAGMTQDEVVAALERHGQELTKAGLSKYERGGSVPKSTVLRALAKVFGVAADFFLDEPQVTVKWLAFRKASELRVAEQDRIKTVAAAQVEAFVALHRALEPKRNQPQAPRTRVNSPDDAESAAEQLRKSWRLGDQPIESVTSAIEDAGGIVVESGDDGGFFDGLSGWVEQSTPVVVVNASAKDDRRRFSLAHELGHLFMDVGNADSKTEEKLAHRFAASFLVPAATAKRELGEKRRHLDLRELAMLKLKHGLSMQAWVYRAADLGIIDQAHCRNLFAEFSAKGWRKEEPVKFEGKEQPNRLRQLTVRAYAEGLLTIAQAERICPNVMQDCTEARPTVPGSMDARSLMKLQKDERDRLMEQAAALVQGDYNPDGALSGFEALGEEDHRDKPIQD
jgi:Zn-dependent peptidase ImmA (M78 family)/transcriptional regulator with XRE-family HTH domain